ncbi:MAG: Maf family protein, partial [Pseudomonadota bacterium]
ARFMLTALADRTHQVMSAVALTDGKRTVSRLQVSEVTFGPLDDAMIAAYWATGEPTDKAGAYAIQGLGAAFVARLEGSYSGVMGLPLFETAALLREFGIQTVRQAA